MSNAVTPNSNVHSWTKSLSKIERRSASCNHIADRILKTVTTVPYHPTAPDPTFTEILVPHFDFFRTRLNPALDKLQADHTLERSTLDPEDLPRTTQNDIQDLGHRCREKYLKVFLPCFDDTKNDGRLKKRAKAGLLRTGYVAVFQICLLKLRERLEVECRRCDGLGYTDRDCIEGGEVLRRLERERLELVMRMAGLVEWNYILFTKFLLHVDFRSERLEVLLQRYLTQEEGVAERVVAGRLEEVGFARFAGRKNGFGMI